MNQTGEHFRFVAFAAGVTAIGGFLFGYDTAVINGANSYLKAHLDLSPAQEGIAGASAILGCIPGAMFAGFLSDRFGRRKLLFLCALLYAGSGLLSALPRTFEQFLAARFISGLGIGASSMICPVYIAEISPEKWRGRLGTLFQLGIVTGIFLTLFVNKVIQGLGDEAWNTTSGWRWMLGMEVVPAVGFVLLLLTVPESPRWLALRGHLSDAHDVLAKAGGKDHADRELAAIQESGGVEKSRLLGSIVDCLVAIAVFQGLQFGKLVPDPFQRVLLAVAVLLGLQLVRLFWSVGPFRKPLLLAVVLMACSQFCGINAIMYYSTKIFAAAGGSTNAAFTSSVWVGLINLAFTFVAIGFVDRAGRRPLLLIGTAVQVIALALVGWMFHTGQSGLPLLLGVIGFIAAFALALGPVGWLFCSEIFPNRIRGRAMSLAALTVWVSCYIVAQTFPMLNDTPAIGPAKTFWAYAAVSLFAFVFALALIPETKGRTLEQIEQMWSAKTAPKA